MRATSLPNQSIIPSTSSHITHRTSNDNVKENKIPQSPVKTLRATSPPNHPTTQSLNPPITQSPVKTLRATSLPNQSIIPSTSSHNIPSLPAELAEASSLQIIQEKGTANAALPKRPKKKDITTVGIHTSGDINFADLSHLPQAGFTAGVSANWKVKKNWSLETGVYYTNKTFISTGANSSDPQLDQRTVSNEVETKMKAIEVPLIAKYEFGNDKKVKPYVAAGISAYVPVKERFLQSNEGNLRTLSSDEQEKELVTTDYNSLVVYSNTLVSQNTKYPTKPYFDIVNLSAGVNIPITQKVNFQAVTNYKTSITKHQLNRSLVESYADRKRRLQSFGVQVGITCSL